MQVNIKKRKRVRHTRFPNGFGSISYLSGNRRRPYWVKKTVGFTEKGYPKYLTIGYFETFEDAFVALCEYNHEPYNIDKQLFIDVSDKWYEEFAGNQADITLTNYRLSCKKCAPLHEKLIREITADELQELVSKQSAGTQAEVIKYLHQVFKYAMRKEFIKKDPSVYLRKTGVTETRRNPFTPEEVRAIWEMPESVMRNGALIMLYTGMRVGEFNTISEVHDNYIIAGEKTEAGKNRIIPLHPKIRPLISNAPKWKRTPAREFAAMFPGHTPHDCRRTFISRCVECGVDPVVSRKIVGHAGKDVHENVYTFLNNPAFLCKEVEKIYY